tara:strand:+ start:26006 stop:27001 length:996 start_codon:yes stop_codon:yes gene_type:complete
MALHTFETDIKDWEDQKKFFSSDHVKKIDDFVVYAKQKHQELFSERNGGKNPTYTLNFKSDHDKLNTLIRQAKRSLNINFKVGQKLEVSKMYSFNYNTYHNTLWPEKDRCLDLEDYGIGNYHAHSDISIDYIYPTGKTIIIGFYGRDFTNNSSDYNLKDIKIKLTLNKFKIFYFNLLNDKYYQEVMNGKALKKINENRRYTGNIQAQLDEILDKIGSDGFGSLTDKEKHYVKSFQKGGEKESYKELTKKEYRDGIFEFELDEIEEQGEGRKVFNGTLKVNDKSFKGYFTHMSTGANDPQFNDEKGLTIWDHADGFEYYLDDFIDIIVADNE